MPRRRLSPLPDGAPAPAPPRADDAPRALRAPVAAAAGADSAAAALREVTDAMVAARAEGRLAELLPLEAVRADHLHRDRLMEAAEGEEMEALVASLHARGQQVPIDVVRLDGGYGLVAGLRRLTALRRLHAETGEARFATVRARVVAPADAAEAYRAMVEENEIRAGVSFWERGRVALKAVEAGAHPDLGTALKGLYGGVSRAKRSKIGSFARLVERLDGVLRFPTALPEHRGLKLAKRLEAEPGLADALRAALAEADPQDAAAEQAAIDRALAPTPAPRPAPRAPAPAPEVRMAESPGKVTLSGPGLTPEFRRDLARWLARR
jgi:ParB-like chromosome segregation protein Spo0J